MVERDNSSKEVTTKVYDERSGSFDKDTGRSMGMLSRILLRELNIPDNPVCLDIGCGTGITSFELKKKILNSGTIVGIDISQSMIEVAVRNLAQQGLNDIELRVGDAEQLDFPDSAFNLVICNMTFHHIPDKLKSLREMHRVLKPGGQVALHSNGNPCFQEIIGIGFAVADRHPEYPEFRDAIREFRDNMVDLEGTIGLVESAGFKDHMTYGRQVIVHVPPTVILDIGHSWDFWESGLPVKDRDDIRAELGDAIKAASGERGFKFTYSTVVSVGTKSG